MMNFFRPDPAWQSRRSQRSPPPARSTAPGCPSTNNSIVHTQLDSESGENNFRDEGSSDQALEATLYYDQLPSGSGSSDSGDLLIESGDNQDDPSVLCGGLNSEISPAQLEWLGSQQAPVVTGAGLVTTRPQTPIRRNNSRGYQQHQQPPSPSETTPHPVFSNTQAPPDLLQEDETIINSALAEAWFARRRENRMQQLLVISRQQQQQQRQAASAAGPMMDPRTGGFQHGPTQGHAQAFQHHQPHHQQYHVPYQQNHQQHSSLSNPVHHMMLGPVDVDEGCVVDPPTATAVALRNPYSEESTPGAQPSHHLHPHHVQAHYDDSATVVSKSNSLSSYPSATTSEMTPVVSNVAYPFPHNRHYASSSYAASSSTAYIPPPQGQPCRPGDEGENGEGCSDPSTGKGVWSCCGSSGGDRSTCKGFLDVRTYHGKLAILLVTILVLAIATMAVSASITFQSHQANQVQANQNESTNVDNGPSSTATLAPAGSSAPATQPPATPPLSSSTATWSPTKAPYTIAAPSLSQTTSNPTTVQPTTGHLPTSAPSSTPTIPSPPPVAKKTQSSHPSSLPSSLPSYSPSIKPSIGPSWAPSILAVTSKPSSNPSQTPTERPSSKTTNGPTVEPTPKPTNFPTINPTTKPPSSPPTVRPTQSLENFSLPKVTTIEGPEAFSNFGTAVALSRSGQVLAVGAPEHSGRKGQVRVLAAAKDGAWVERAVLIGENFHDTFGFDVSLSEDGSILAVGASGGNGTVYTYVYNPGLDNYTPLGEPIRGADSGASFGHSVSLSQSGFRMAVGAPYTSTSNFVLNGQLRVYELRGDIWTPMGNGLNGDASVDWLGSAVDIYGDGNLVIASAPRNRAKKGYVRTWTWNGDEWEKVGPDITNSVQPAYSSDRFGHSVALSVGSAGRPRVAIGSPWKTVEGKRDVGMTLVYEFVGNRWDILGNPVTLSPPTAYTENGNAVDLDGGILIVGVPGAGNRGAVALYRLLDGDWVMKSEIIYGENIGDDFGVSLSSHRDPSTDGFALVVGALMSGSGGAGYVASYVKQD
mmetsp:Transcript_16560/g.34156  ORF Transcript_16560/g.34156 Transcript_16560/m.34156 type:complete len:1040 (-) Transcript_16560:108-3227(-)